MVVALGVVSFGLMPSARAADAASISGTVTDAVTGLPASGVAVSLLKTETHYAPTGDPVVGWVWQAGVTTDSSGHYAFTGLPAANGDGNAICFGGFDPNANPQYVAQCYNDQPGYDSFASPLGFVSVPDAAQPIHLSAGQAVSGIDAHMTLQPPPPPSYVIQGDVVNATTHQEISGGTVSVFDAATATVPVTTAMTTTGGFRVYLPGPGTYYVCFDAATVGTGYLDQCYQGVAWSGSSGPSAGTTPVTVTANVAVDVSAQLAPAAAFKGTVSEALLNLRLSGVRMYAISTTGAVYGPAVTSKTGTYRLSDVVPGGYYVCFDARYAKGGVTLKGYQSRCVGNVAWAGAGAPVPKGAVALTATGGVTDLVNISINASLK